MATSKIMSSWPKLHDHSEVSGNLDVVVKEIKSPTNSNIKQNFSVLEVKPNKY